MNATASFRRRKKGWRGAAALGGMVEIAPCGSLYSAHRL